MRPHLPLLLTLPLLALFTAACTNDESGSTKHDISIVATTSLWGSVVEAVVDDFEGFEVSSLITEDDTDPSTYELSDADREELETADIVVANGGKLDAQLTQDLNLQDDVVVSALPVIQPDEIDANTPNPYIWFDLDLVDHFADHLAQEISQLVPDFPRRATGVNTEIARLADIRDGLAETPVVLTSALPELFVRHTNLEEVSAQDASVVLDAEFDTYPNATAIKAQASAASIVQFGINTSDFFTYYEDLVSAVATA
ncbi:MAG: zinc ABC transporter substrate-binding protein [Corynebacterium sp.]|nr:zinc ABC transporter substrate-binding protein [Corynebacterium sp.]